MSWGTWFLVFVLLWLGFNVLAPYSILLTATKISPGRLPAELLVWPQDRKVRFYMSNLVRGYGFSVWAPPLNIIVFDKKFFSAASPALIRYVIAHELGHFSLGHHRKRWFAVVTGVVLIPAVRRWLHKMEDQADELATKRTGFVRSAFPELGGT